MMEAIRRSPATFAAETERVENRDGWRVVLEYREEGGGPWLVDLSHRSKWDIQDREVATLKPFGLAIPDAPGQCLWQNGTLINRMNRTQASIWSLSGQLGTPEDARLTETTDGPALLALMGPGVFGIMERISNLDLAKPGLQAPFLAQGPVLHIPCQVVVFDNNPDSPVVLISFSRGYGESFAAAVLHAGHDEGLRPAGEDAFTKRFPAA